MCFGETSYVQDMYVLVQDILFLTLLLAPGPRLLTALTLFLLICLSANVKKNPVMTKILQKITWNVKNIALTVQLL